MSEPSDILAAAKGRIVELTLAGSERGAEGTALALLLAPRSVPGAEQRAADEARLTELFYRRLRGGLVLRTVVTTIESGWRHFGMW